MKEPIKAQQERKYARWAMLMLTLLMSAALLVTTSGAYQGAQRGSLLAEEGQGAALINLLHTYLRVELPHLNESQLQQWLEDTSDAQITYLLIADEVSGQVWEVGESQFSSEVQERFMDPNSPGEPTYHRRDDRVRLEFQLALPLRPPPGERARRPDELVGFSPGGPPSQFKRAMVEHPRIAVEFVPSVALELRASATWSLVSGLVATVVLLIAAALVWWLLTKQALLAQHKARERRLAALGEMSAVLSHELRNPLTSLKGHTQLLIESLEPGRKHNKAQRILEEALRLEKLTGDLLDFVRDRPLRREEVQLAELLNETAAAVLDSVNEPAMSEPGLTLKIEVDDNLSWSLDREAFRRVLINLLNNAVQASPEGAPIVLAAKRQDNDLVIEVRDQGEGFDEAFLDQLFEPFKTQKIYGTGLGLAIVKRVVEAHDGEVHAENTPSGALLSLRIPQGRSDG